MVAKPRAEPDPDEGADRSSLAHAITDSHADTDARAVFSDDQRTQLVAESHA